MEIVTWKTETGKKVEAKISLETEKTIWADGDKVVVACCEMRIIATIDEQFVGSGKPEKANHPTCVAKIGKLGITTEHLTLINAAIARVEASPEWQAKLQRIIKAEKEGREYETHRERMRKIMGY